MLKTVGKNIRLQRKILDLSIKQMAEELKLSESTITSIEGGKRIGNSFVKYLLYLKVNGVDLNTIFSINETN